MFVRADRFQVGSETKSLQSGTDRALAQVRADYAREIPVQFTRSSRFHDDNAFPHNTCCAFSNANLFECHAGNG